jgi:hypothetical protein
MALALSLSYPGPVERGIRFDQAVDLSQGRSKRHLRAGQPHRTPVTTLVQDGVVTSPTHRRGLLDARVRSPLAF